MFIRPLLITLDRIVTSILPPETTQTTFLPLTGSLLNITAATETAPAPSAIIFCCSISARIAEEISSSVTVTISSTYFLIYSNGVSPICLTAVPSAIVLTSLNLTSWSSSTAANALAAPSGSTPTILTDGLICFAAQAIPEINPPPPIGTRI